MLVGLQRAHLAVCKASQSAKHHESQAKARREWIFEGGWYETNSSDTRHFIQPHHAESVHRHRSKDSATQRPQGGASVPALPPVICSPACGSAMSAGLLHNVLLFRRLQAHLSGTWCGMPPGCAPSRQLWDGHCKDELRSGSMMWRKSASRLAALKRSVHCAWMAIRLTSWRPGSRTARES